MQIKVAETAGFCFGVNRAVDTLDKMLGQGKKVCTLGPIIHNNIVVDDFKKKGAVIIDSPEAVPDGYGVVIRAHGVTKQVIDKLDQLGIDYVDATCPYVLKIHRIIKENSREDNTVLIAGDEQHPEVCGFRSHCKGESFVFRNSDELEKILSENRLFTNKEIIVVAQTTFSVKEWKKSLKIIEKVCTNRNSFDTICKATQNRQDEAEKLSAECDAMIVIGGRHSSNTVKLKNVCETNCKTFLIERVEEVGEIDFSPIKELA